MPKTDRNVGFSPSKVRFLEPRIDTDLDFRMLLTEVWQSRHQPSHPNGRGDTDAEPAVAGVRVEHPHRLCDLVEAVAQHRQRLVGERRLFQAVGATMEQGQVQKGLKAAHLLANGG
jgi:hypothetical protein